ncbi:hypothetical protein [Nonlabens antarcticus]|uniref:hypothetical protein n=1 Tax=Nonlabens antarcticus TaxID=392714 RepID=UPI001890ED46|nr:hypothetical protein [Nonlabens antarcticus]
MKLNNIKNKFEGREIQPSADSWEKLSQRLDSEKTKSKKPIIFWLGAIAAVLVLGLTMVPSLFVADSETQADQKIVIEEPAIENSDTETKLQKPIPVIQDQNNSVAASEGKEPQPATNEAKPKAPKARVVQDPFLNQKNEIAFEEVKEQESKSAISKPNIIIEDVAAVAQNNNANPISESDALLNKALENIAIKNKGQTTGIAANKTRSINPQKLLRETEWDLEAQRRNRLENTLLNGLGRLKREAVALIDRNQ